MGWLQKLLRRETPEDTFAAKTVRELAERGERGPFDYDRGAFALRGRGTDRTWFLHNLFVEHQRTDGEAERRELFDSFLRSVREAEVPMEWAVIAPLVRPVLRHQPSLTGVWLDAATRQQRDIWDGAFTQFAPGVALCVAADRPDTIMLLNRDSLGELGVTFEVALEQARANLAAMAPPEFRLDVNGYFISNDGDLYDASRLLLADYAQSLPLAGEPIVIPLARNGVFVADSAKPESFAALIDHVLAEGEANPRTISRAPLVRRDGRWVPHDPASEAGRAFEKLTKVQAADDAECLREPIQKQTERDRRDIFVASFILMEQNGRFWSYCVWSPVPSLLPRTDYIAIRAREDATDVLMRRWDDVMEVCGSRFIAEDWDPPRWFVEDGVTKAELAALEGKQGLP